MLWQSVASVALRIQYEHIYIKDARLHILLFPSQKTLLRTYGGLARFVINEGQPVIDGLKSMEARAVGFSVYNLRGLEGLLTPEARKEVMMVLPEVKKVQDLEKAILTSKHRQWANFVWLAHPNLDESKSMPQTHIHYRT